MRKKSHILLARYLADQMEMADSLQSHRKAFCLGNILPDIRPSFLTTKHEYFGTFETVQEKIARLVEDGPEAYKERVFWRRLGEVVHYIADYFTFPHNRTYTGTLIEHGQYEKALKKRLKSYIKSGEAYEQAECAMSFKSLGELMEYVRISHERYLAKMRNITDDIHYILSVCFQFIQGVFHLCDRDSVIGTASF